MLLVTAAAVIIVAVVAAFCGVAIAAITAIAGLVALVLFAADAICMLAIGEKGIADICNENGLWWLGQIFSGVSIGCDLVTILLPLGAAIKTMSRVVIKTFGKGLIASMKTSFKESMEAIWKNGFKQEFGKGLKNMGKILFKTFIFDIDDITKVDDGVRTWNLMEDKLVAKNPNKNWIDVARKIYPSHTEIPGQFNPDNLTTKELFEETCKSLGIDMAHIPKDKWGNPNNPLVQLNQKLHSSKVYNFLQLAVNAAAIFTARASSTMKCFVAGTLILTVAGYSAIENIRAGDKVISMDPDTQIFLRL